MKNSQVLLLVVACGVSGCSSSANDSLSGDFSGGVPSDSSAQQQGSQIQPGVLTAGEWDDNRNYELFVNYLSSKQSQFTNRTLKLPGTERIVVTVKNERGEVIPFARLTVSDGTKQLLTMNTASDGQALLFPDYDGWQATRLTLLAEAPQGQNGVTPTTQIIDKGGQGVELVLSGAKQVQADALDLAFVIDTTGSMGDELRYVQNEVRGIASQVRTLFPSLSLRFGLVVYRDTEDSYVTRSFNFTDSLDQFTASLSAQSAGGGGDMPEAMDRGLSDMNQLSYRSGNTAHVAFLIADAPSHDENAQAVLDQANQARRQGTHIYSLAASGIDSKAEYLLRIGSEMSHGRYLFLTDDSGVGNTHAEPTIPCYEVQYLNKLMLRAISAEVTGVRPAVPSSDVIRSVGSPSAGVCTLPSGKKAYLP